MHRTLCMELSVWSSFDHLWAAFRGELLGDDVISWPCSFRQWRNHFMDLRALSLWIFVIGVEVPKNVYNSCPLKHEVINHFWCRVKCLLWGSEVFLSWEVTCYKIQYNSLYDNIFSWSSWGGHSHARLYKFIFTYIGQTIVCLADWWFRLIILWFGWSYVRQWCTFDVFIFLNISQPRWMKLDLGSSNSSNLRSKYKSIHVKNVLESNMERHHLITSQWCKLLTGVRGITDNDDDPKGTTVQFTWCENETWRRTPR